MDAVIGWVRRLFSPRAPSLQEQVTEKRLTLELKALEAANSVYGDVVDPREPLWDDASFYPPYGAPEILPFNYDNRLLGEAIPYYLTEWGLKVLRDQSRRLAGTNEFAINALTNRKSYTVGKGMQYKAVKKPDDGSSLPTFEERRREKREAREYLDDRIRRLTSRTQWGALEQVQATALLRELQEQEAPTNQETDPLAKAVQAVIDEFLSRTAWGEREQEVVWRADRDGEAFIRLFHVGHGRTEVRFVEPEWVKDYSGLANARFGIVTDPDDIEDVQAYQIVERPDVQQTATLVPADEVVHVKLNTDSTAKRGVPTLYPVRKNLERADKLLRNMSVLATTQATFALIRKHKQYSGSAVSAFQQAKADVSRQNPITGNTQYGQVLQPGSIIDTSENTEYEFPGAKINASGLVDILAAELRAVAARLCMPEYMLTTDASNANFASTLVAEAPSTKNFESLGAFFARRFGDGGYSPGRLCGVLWRVIAIAVEYGRLPSQALTEIELQAEGPTLTVRDKPQETQRAKTLNESGVLSKETWSKWEGLDREQEKRHLQLEQAEAPQPQQPPMPGMPPGGAAFPPSPSTPEPSPPGSAGGFGGDDDDFTEDVKRGTDKRGRPYCTDDGRRVPCHSEDEKKAQRAQKAQAKADAKPKVPTSDQAKEHIERIKAEGAQPHTVAALASSLARMKRSDIDSLKKELGLWAGGKTKSALADKVAAQATARITQRQQWDREARKVGVPPKALHNMASRVHAGNREYTDDVRRCISDARAMYKAANGGKVLSRKMKALNAGDYASIPGFDVLSRSMAGRYPGLLGAHGYEHSDAADPDADEASQRLFDLLAAGTPPLPKREDSYAEALEYLASLPPEERKAKGSARTKATVTANDLFGPDDDDPFPPLPDHDEPATPALPPPEAFPPDGEVRQPDKLTTSKLSHATKSKLVPSLSEHETQTIKDYTDSANDPNVGYSAINAVARGEREDADGSVGKLIDALDAAIAKAPPLPRPIYVYRGLNVPPEKHAEMMAEFNESAKTGELVTLRGFSSSSLDPSAAHDFTTSTLGGHRGAGQAVHLEIRAKSGAYVAPLAVGSMAAYEAEFLPPRDCQVRVVSVSGPVKINGHFGENEVRYVQLEQI